MRGAAGNCRPYRDPYISTLERGLYAPTIEKLDDIAAVLGTHPMTLMIGSYALKDNRSVAKVLEDVIGAIERLEVAEGVSKLRKRYPKTE